MRRLLVLRHGKSDWDTGGADHDRTLNDRGRRSADAIGELLTSAGLVPDLAYTSTAVRAHTTLERAVLAGDWSTTVETRESLYMSSVGAALDVAAKAPDDADSVMLVGHEPVWGELVQRLTSAHVVMGTATVVVMELDIMSWTMAPAARGRITDVLRAGRFLPR